MFNLVKLVRGWSHKGVPDLPETPPSPPPVPKTITVSPEHVDELRQLWQDYQVALDTLSASRFVPRAIFWKRAIEIYPEVAGEQWYVNATGKTEFIFYEDLRR